MKRNPLMPFVLIFVLGVAGMFFMSFKGLDDMEKIAAQEENGGEQKEEAQTNGPEALYQSLGCMGCHGTDYAGQGDFPSLLGVGDRLSHEEIVDIIVNGKGNMPPGLATPEEAEELANWLATLK